MVQTTGEHSEAAMVSAERAQPMSVDETGMFVTRNSQELWRVAKMLLATGAAPKSYREPEQVVVAIQALKSMGLNPYVSLRQTGMINGSFTVWGDLPLALVRAGGEVEWIDEFFFTMRDGEYLRQCFDNANCHELPFGAVCRVKRTGHPAHESVFTIQHAKQANLLGKPGPWTQYTDRMMRYRARSGALKDVFSDAMQGVAIKEYDLEGVEIKDHPPRGSGPVYNSMKTAKPAKPAKPLHETDEVQRVKEKVEAIKREKEAATAVRPAERPAKSSPESSIIEPDTIIDPNDDISAPDESESELMEAAMLEMRKKIEQAAGKAEDHKEVRHVG